MTVRRARTSDLERIMELYEIGREYMRKTGNLTQWVNGYPSRELVLSDISANELYLICDGECVAGVFYYAQLEDPTYAYIEGEWLNSRPYGVIHRIAGDGVHHGIFRTAFEYVNTFIREIRVDTHEDNKTMQKSVEKCGFKRCGTIYISDGTPRISYHYSNPDN